MCVCVRVGKRRLTLIRAAVVITKVPGNGIINLMLPSNEKFRAFDKSFMPATGEIEKSMWPQTKGFE